MVYAMHKDFLSLTLSLIELLKAEGQYNYSASTELSHDSSVSLLGTKVSFKSGKPIRVSSADIDVELNWLMSMDSDLDETKEYGRAVFTKGDVNDLIHLSANIKKFLGCAEDQMQLAA